MWVDGSRMLGVLSGKAPPEMGTPNENALKGASTFSGTLRKVTIRTQLPLNPARNGCEGLGG